MVKVDSVINNEIETCHTHSHFLDHVYFVCFNNINFDQFQCKKCNFLTFFLKQYIHLKQIAYIKNVKNESRNKKHEIRFASRTTNRFLDKHD